MRTQCRQQEETIRQGDRGKQSTIAGFALGLPRILHLGVRETNGRQMQNWGGQICRVRKPLSQGSRQLLAAMTDERAKSSNSATVYR